MKQDIACPAATAGAVLHSESVSFSEIPGQSRLFLEYQRDPLSLKRFYPSAVASHFELAGRIPDVLAAYQTDRSELCAALGEINGAMGAGSATFDNIEKLRDHDCVAVLTGQQAGLFTGPLYTIYKALSAVREAKCLSDRGHKAVPVFWIATEDHDFAEVDEANIVGSDNAVMTLRSGAAHADGTSVATATLTPSIERSIDQMFGALRRTEFTQEMRSLIEDAYAEGAGFGTAFGRMLAVLMRRYGLVLVDPMHVRLKRLASAIYVQAIRRSGDIAGALDGRNAELQAAGFEPQVATGKDYFPLFWTSEDGQRTALRFLDGAVRAKGNSTVRFTLDQLSEMAADRPELFSPNVMLRPVVQDHLFPTICYFGGGAEIAYFAQNSEVYRVLDRPVTPILHRQSFTVVEPKHRRSMAAYDLKFTDLFAGLDGLLPHIVDGFLDKATAKTFADVEETINAQLNRLDRELSEIDQGLAVNLATRRRKIIYHIAALRDKFRAVELRKDKTIHRRIEGLFNSLLPSGGLQERTINVVQFLNSYGHNFIDWIYDASDLDDRSHRVLYI